MQHYEGLVVPQKDGSSPKATEACTLPIHTRVFCIRADKSDESDCLNITCERCLFGNNNTVKFNKWYAEMTETFAARKTATIH